MKPTELRRRVHARMLEKSESVKDLAEANGDLTVVPLGFAVDVAMKLIHKQRHEDWLLMADALMDRRISADEALKEWEANQMAELENSMLLGMRVVEKDWMPDGSFALVPPSKGDDV